MNVCLAAQASIVLYNAPLQVHHYKQALSKSVADLFATFQDIEKSDVTIYEDTTETEKFCRIFNKLFDIFNARHLNEATRKRNDNLKPYTDLNDERLKVLYLMQHYSFTYLLMNVVVRERVFGIFGIMEKLCYGKTRSFS
jgi:hypothetical protein